MNDRKTFRQAVDDHLAPLEVSPALKQAILQNATGPQKKKRTSVRFKQAFVSAAAACLVLVFGVKAAAAAFPAFESFLQHMGQDLRLFMQPLDESDIADGIELRVAAAVNDGESAIVYFTLQDLEGKGRVDADTNLLDLQACGNSFVFANLVHFDAEKGIATYRLEQTDFDGIQDKRFCLQLNGFASGEEFAPETDTGLTVADIKKMYPSPAFISLGKKNSSGYSFAHSTLPKFKPHEEKMLKLLEQDEMPVLDGLGNETKMNPGWLVLSNAGVSKDYLHLERQTSEGVELFYQASFSLRYDGLAEADQLPAAQVPLGKTISALGRDFGSYTEDILLLPDGIAHEDIKIFANILTYKQLTTGSWQVNFVLDKNQPVKSIACNLEQDGWKIHTLQVSSIGISAELSGKIPENSFGPQISVYLTDGSSVASNSSHVLFAADDNVAELKENFDRPVNLDEIAKVVVNGHTFSFE